MKKIFRVLILVFSALNIIWAFFVIQGIPFMSGHPMAKGYQSVDKLESRLNEQPQNHVIEVEREDLERATWYAKAQFKQSSNYVGTSLLLSLSMILTSALLFVITFSRGRGHS